MRSGSGVGVKRVEGVTGSACAMAVSITELLRA